MQQPFLHKIHNQHFWLTPQRCIFWEEQKTIIASDLHLGKTGHFRKHGIAVPQNVYKEDLQRLLDVVTYFKAEHFIAVGDLFHSTANKEMDLFLKWRQDVSQLNITLVEGNHDILKKSWYTQANIDIKKDCFETNGFRFVHDICTAEDEGVYCISGHIHPGVSIKGIAKQSLSFPCYFFGETHAVLPAFSRFTGISLMHKTKQDQVFAIVEQSIIKI